MITRQSLRRLLEQDATADAKEKAAELGVPYTYTENGVTYTYVGNLSDGSGGTLIRYSKPDGPQIRISQEEAQKKKSGAPVAVVPRIPATAAQPRIAPESDPETGLGKLNAELGRLKSAMGAAPDSASKENFSYDNKALVGNKAWSDFDSKSDKGSAATLGVLVYVCRFLKEKVNDPKFIDGLKRKLKDWKDKAQGKGPELSAGFKETEWNTMIDDLARNSLTDKIFPKISAYLSSANFPAGTLPFEGRESFDSFAEYLAFLADAAGVNVPEKPVSTKTSGSGAASRSTASGTGSASTPTPAPAPADDPLLLFLANNVDLYYEKYARNLANNAKPNNALGDAIKQGNEFGPSASAALTALIETIESRAANKADLFFTDYPNKINNLESLKNATTKPSWSGAGDKFPAGDQGLIRFLRFTYAASAGPKYNDVEKAAAQVEIRSGGTFFSDDTLWQELLFSGAASPFPFLTILGPNNDMIPQTAKIFIELGGSETGPVPAGDAPSTPTLIKLKELKRDYPKGLVVCIGRNDGDTATIKGFSITPDVSGEPAKSLLKMMGQQVRFILQIEDEAYVLVTTLSYATPIIDFKAIVPKPAPAAGPSAADLAREVTNITSRPGRTVAGTSPGFELDNVYIKKDGSPAVRRTPAILQKRVPVGGGDDFELRVANPSFEYILVPVRLRSPLGSQVISESRRMLSEQAAHWVVDYSLSRQQLAAPGPGANVGFLPVQSIRWRSDKNMVTYGPGGFSVIDASYDPTPIPRESLPEDINIITPEQAMRMGEAGPGGNPIKYAITSYVASDTNPLGTPLYLSKDLNTVINNTFRRATVAAGGYN